MAKAGAPDAERRVEALLVSSCGGHLVDLLLLRAVWKSLTRTWVTLDSPDARSLLRGESVVYAHEPGPRSVLAIVRNLWLAIRVVRACRPNVLLSTGAGLAFPFVLAARLFGADVIYLECSGRIDTPSLTSRLVAPFARHVYVQSESLEKQLRKGRYLGRLWVHDSGLPEASAAPSRATPAEGDFVFVTVGTCSYPFDRLLRAVARLPRDERLVVQHGSSAIVDGALSFDYLPFEDVIDLMRRAKVVVTHAGTGSVMSALAMGKRPIVMARRQQFGEQPDDHQVAFADWLAHRGLATVVEDEEALASAVARSQLEQDAPVLPRSDAALIEAVRRNVEQALAGRARPAAVTLEAPPAGRALSRGVSVERRPSA